MRVLILALLIAVSTPALAEKDYCGYISSISKTIMKARQKGLSMQQVIEIVGSDTLLKEIVVSAYNKQRYMTEKFQERESDDFRDKWYLACYKATEDSHES